VEGKPCEMRDFSVTAIIAAYNEGDVIDQVVTDLVRQGVGVYLLDDGSSDDTVARAEAAAGSHLLGVERMQPTPAEPGSTGSVFSLRRIITRKQQLACELPGDWFLNADADELRESPWLNLDLSAAIRLVDHLGYNAIDFAVFEFWPTHDRFRRGDDLRVAFPFCEPGHTCDRLQIRCWKRTSPLDLVSSGGHEAVFRGRRVFPLRFILRHYPFRGSEHGRRKLLEERRPRYDPEEQALGWHGKYDTTDLTSLVRDPVTLRRFEPDEVRALLAVENRLVEELRGDPEALRLAEIGCRAELVLLEGEVSRRDKELARFGEELEARSRECSQLHAALAASRGELAARRAEIEELRRSLSWRLTAPLRAALKVVRGY